MGLFPVHRQTIFTEESAASEHSGSCWFDCQLYFRPT